MIFTPNFQTKNTILSFPAEKALVVPSVCAEGGFHASLLFCSCTACEGGRMSIPHPVFTQGICDP